MRKRGARREPVDPGEWPARVDDRLRIRRHSVLLLVRRDARIQGRAPGIAHDVDLLGGFTARRDRPGIGSAWKVSSDRLRSTRAMPIAPAVAHASARKR